ncbi:PTS system sucrose-specific IIB component, Glc family /PTS system sucrose-specific IIC component, Glc family [Clostridium amylolyticum]|uniref:PTS system sucrose-specific IIB component, Glc family /PTS system sucrose-specific IIC component, Glc family n=1 Tax=Clostridium amylolyticum TaxID=1121298 RepID=A0A1M6GJD5_9CLOT|nr:PTS transporter subunit EIIC [Clostridium amylolyticum]SHJ10057.1 PTS system sucrose-specific IIB component, Glc family /PTS system sucrose-specific IIC component, Glc family [Clostridium amylolyticum]
MSSKELAKEILENIGGKENIQAITHCATRLRITLKDDNKANAEEIKKLDKVVTALMRNEQFQIILGVGLVNEVYDEIIQITGNLSSDSSQNKKYPKGVKGVMKRLSNIFVPLIPALVGGGMLMGVNYLLQQFGVVSDTNQISQLLGIFSSSAFVFLYILVGFTAAKEFGGTPVLGAAIAGILMHPDLVNIKSVNLFGLNLSIQKGAGGIFAVLLAIWFMSFVENKIRKIIPQVFRLILVPLLTMVITGFVAIYILQPIGTALSNGFANLVTFAINKGGILTGLFLGGTFSTVVTTGLHQGLTPLYVDLLNKTGVNPLLPILAMADVGQAGAALAVYFKAKNPKIKSIAANSIPVALMGITEPVMFGCNIPLGKPFIAAAIGSALGGAFIAASKVVSISLGLSSIPLIAIIQKGFVLRYIIGFIIAFAGAFIGTYIMGFDENTQVEELSIMK